MSITFADTSAAAALTAREVAAIMRVTPRSVTNWAASGRIPSVRVGRSIRIPRYAVAAILTDPAHRRVVAP